MNPFYKLSLLVTTLALSACASTPEQKAQYAAAQKRHEQNLQVSLAAQCDKETASIMQQQFEQTDHPVLQMTKEQKEFRLKYIDKIADPMFQACYKMAWQNYISQQKLREAYDYYDDWRFYHPFNRHPFWW